MEGRTAIVTGAGSGMGRAIADLFATQGAAVAVVDINRNACEEVARELTARGCTAIPVATDVSDPVQVASMVEDTTRRLSHVDILINAAGIISHGSVEETEPAQWDRVLAVNLRGPFLCARAVMPVMRSQRWGRIVSIASMSGKTGGIVVGADYCASKAGVVALTKSLAKQGAPFGILVNAISPGIVDTPMTQTHAESVETMRSQIPLGRIAQPKEIAYAALFLCSGLADYITGQTLHVNGGMVMPD